jgi:hypothetical protein
MTQWHKANKTINLTNDRTNTRPYCQVQYKRWKLSLCQFSSKQTVVLKLCLKIWPTTVLLSIAKVLKDLYDHFVHGESILVAGLEITRIESHFAMQWVSAATQFTVRIAVSCDATVNPLLEPFFIIQQINLKLEGHSNSINIDVRIQSNRVGAVMLLCYFFFISQAICRIHH